MACPFLGFLSRCALGVTYKSCANRCKDNSSLFEVGFVALLTEQEVCAAQNATAKRKVVLRATVATST